MSDIIETLTELLGEAAVLTGSDVTARASSYWDASPMQAKALVRPASTAEVAAVLRLCHQENQSVVTHGGLTGCVQGSKSDGGDIILSMERMNRIEDIDTVSHTLTVQAGAVLENVQNQVAEAGMFLPLDLGARGSCTIGGNVATNAGGVNVIRYGMARALVLGLEAVLPDGTVLSSMNRMLKNNAGFDLKQLFIGTEGALGVVTRIVLRLQPQSTTRNTALAALPNFAAIPLLLNHLKSSVGASLSAFEAMWGNYMREVTEYGWHKAPMDRSHSHYILFECDGSDPARDDDRFMEVIEAAFEQGIIVDAVVPKSEAERKAIWAIRDDFEAIVSVKPVFLYDVSLPITSMEAYVSDVERTLAELLPTGRLFTLGHIGDGNLHFFVQAHTDDPAARELSDRSIYEPLAAYNGSVSAEHGIGFEKKGWLQQSRSEAEIEVMRRLKHLFDPKGLLNAGVVVD